MLELEKVTKSTHLTDVEVETQRVVVAFLVSRTPGSSSPLRTTVWVPGSAHSAARLPLFLLPLAFLRGILHSVVLLLGPSSSKPTASLSSVPQGSSTSGCLTQIIASLESKRKGEGIEEKHCHSKEALVSLL